jgi:hypothetical protein
MEQTCNQMRQMLQQMERVQNDPETTGNQLRQMNRVQERVQNMIQEMEQAQQALAELAIP